MRQHERMAGSGAALGAFALLPLAAIVDYELTYTVPPRTTAPFASVTDRSVTFTVQLSPSGSDAWSVRRVRRKAICACPKMGATHQYSRPGLPVLNASEMSQ